MMDSLGLMLFFIMTDLSLRGPLSYIYYWNPFDYFFITSYPLRVFPGTFAMFCFVWVGHLIASIVSLVKYRDPPYKYLTRVVRTYF